jgi:N4-gp56 family major capsid protein
MTQLYNAPLDGSPTSVGEQIRTDFYDRNALFENRKERYFAQWADVRAMPKNTGKKIKLNHMMPLLDVRNVNDQGIDAAGTVLDSAKWTAWNAEGVLQGVAYATEAAAKTAAGVSGSFGKSGGNLYGSSKDIGNIRGKLPLLGEEGGRVNRIGSTRLTLEGTFENYGMFMEFSEDLLNFDSMADLYEHMSRELVSGAVQLTEALIQMDLLDAAGVIRYAGTATQNSELTGEGANISEVNFTDLQRSSIILDNNRCPKAKKMIKGSTNFDTVTVGNGRLLYCGSEMIPTLTKMKDHFNNQAFVSVEHYGYAGSHKEGTGMIHGEIGKIGAFRVVVVPEMQKWAGKGGAVTTNGGYQETNGQYDVFPLLCFGPESFTTIGFQTGGGSDFKFKIHTKMPHENITTQDPYGKTGFSSIQFNYGFMPLRPERILVIKSVAEQ